MKHLLFLLFATTAFAEVKTETITIAMRDGVKLTADLYRDDAVTKAPVILTRTPYDRTKQKGTGEKWAKAGYIFIAQDCRGKFGSAGDFAPYNNEGQDGYDTIEWITRQPWCSGRVGMMGGSYVGAVQWQAAVEHPPGLAAIAPQATWGSFYRNLYLGGSVRLALIAGWIAGNSPKPDGAKPNDFNEAFLHLPLSEVDNAIGWDMPWLDAFLTHPEPDGFWTRLDLTPRLPELQLPALHVVGYYDFFSRESVDNFTLMQKEGRDPETRRQQRLILGPWDHGSVGRTKTAEVEFGPEAAVDVFAIQLDWFDRHLKQDPAALSEPFPPVRYFSMGDNVWHDAQTWPPEGFTPTSLYLHSDGQANTRRGNGRLTRTIGDTSAAHLFVATILPQKAPRPGWEKVDAYNASLPAIVAAQKAAGKRITLVDMHAAITTDDLLPDGVHPNQAGMERMAARWFAALNVSLKKTNQP